MPDRNGSLPFSEDAEKGVLCSLILSAREIAPKCVSLLAPEAFYIPTHRLIYSAILDSADAVRCGNDGKIDFVWLKQTLEARGQLDEVGGNLFLNEVYSFIPTAANADYYIAIVRDQYCLRRVIQFSSNLSARCGDRAATPEDLLAEAQTELAEISKISLSGKDPVSFKERIFETIDWIEQLKTDPPESVVRFGIDALDSALLPIEPGNQVVICAETSGGKTALAIQAVLNSPGKTFVIFSVEMRARSLVARMFSNEGHINFSNLRRGSLTEPEVRQLHEAVKRLANREIYIEDQHPIDVRSIAAKCRLLKERGLSAVVVDYLQLIAPSTTKRDLSREREVAEISRSLKSLALELDIVVIALSQLNEAGQLRESRAIGQDADVVLRILREDDTDQIVIWKHRNGPCLTVPVIFDGAKMRFFGVTGKTTGDNKLRRFPYREDAA